MKIVYSLILAASIVCATWLFRWSEPVAIDGSKALLIDRWTGDVWMVYHGQYGGAKQRINLDISEDKQE